MTVTNKKELSSFSTSALRVELEERGYFVAKCNRLCFYHCAAYDLQAGCEYLGDDDFPTKDCPLEKRRRAKARKTGK